MSRELIHRFVSMRRNHPAWLLASRTGPLVLGSLRALIDVYPGAIGFSFRYVYSTIRQSTIARCYARTGYVVVPSRFAECERYHRLS